MKSITLYHGSEYIIEKPVYGYGNPNNDYGLAFYCTRDFEMAKEWAVFDNVDGFANEYEISLSGLKLLDLDDGSYNILNWLAILLENRVFRMNGIALKGKEYLLSEFLPDYRNYDVIKGYRADDSYFAFANAFLNNSLPLDALYNVMKLGKFGEQYAIVSNKAFDSLKYTGYHKADSCIYYPKKKSRDNNARQEYQNDYKNILDGIFLVDILREEWKNGDKRLRPIIY